MLKLVHVEIVSIGIKTIENLSLISVYIKIVSSMIRLDLCREYLIISSDNNSQRFERKMVNDL